MTRGRTDQTDVAATAVHPLAPCPGARPPSHWLHQRGEEIEIHVNTKFGGIGGDGPVSSGVDFVPGEWCHVAGSGSATEGFADLIETERGGAICALCLGAFPHRQAIACDAGWGLEV